MIGTRCLCVGIVATSALLCVGHAAASDFYGVNQNGLLSRFDMTAHTVTALGTIHTVATSPTGFGDLDFDASGNLYAVRNFFDSGSFQNFNEAYRVTNTATGNALLSSSLGSTVTISLGYNPGDSNFYGVNGVNGFLGSINVNTGAFAPVSGVGNGIRNTVWALAFNPVTGLAYGIIDAGSPPPFGSDDFSLISMNMATGLSTVIGSLGVGGDIVQSLRFDAAGVAYTVDSDNGNVYTVDLGTGHATFLFAGGSAAVGTTGLAYIAVPGPGVAGTLAVAGAMAGRRRSRPARR